MTLRSFGLVALVTAPGCGVVFDALSQPPRPQISSHEDDEGVREGIPFTVRGTVGDPDDLPDQLEAWWTADDAIVCDRAVPSTDGQTTCEFALTDGPHEVRLHVEDPDGGVGSDAVTLWSVPTGAPEARIFEPLVDGIYYEDRLVRFSGEVGDAEDRAEDLEVWWEIDGARADIDAIPDSTGRVSGVGLLPEGDDHVVTLQVRDSSDKTGDDSVGPLHVQPTNSPPDCDLVSPPPGSHSAVGETVVFRGRATDPNVSVDELDVRWSSDLDGALGVTPPGPTGDVALSVPDLSLGTHIITLEVEDDLGALCTDTRVYQVGSPPTVTVTGPAPGSDFSIGTSVTLSARLTDIDDPITTLEVVWTSSLQGSLGSSRVDPSGNTSLTSTALASGDHDVTITVTDALGQSDTDTTTFSINTPPTAAVVVIEPDAPLTDDDLTARIAVESVDDDPVSYTWRWSRNGTVMVGPEFSGPVLANAETERDDTWQVEVTPDDGRNPGPSATASIQVGNTAPTMSGATIAAGTYVEGSTVTCAPQGVFDLDGDPVSLVYAWRVNDLPIAPVTGAIGSEWFVHGDRVSCEITATDLTNTGASVQSGAVTIQNTAPSISNVEVSPDAAQQFEVLTCTYDFDDVDGDSDQSTLRWTVNGTQRGTGRTLAGVFAENDVVVCAVTANDGATAGSSGSDSTVIAPSTPSASNVLISPANATISSTLTCSYVFTDPQNDPNQSRVQWRINGEPAGSGTVLASGTFRKDDVITCTVTPDDGRFEGTPAVATLTVGNTPPTGTAVQVFPQDVIPGATPVTCALQVGLEASDADADPLTYAFTWTRNGTPYTGPTTTDATSSVVPAASVGALELWECTVRAFDGDDYGPGAVDDVTSGQALTPVISADRDHTCRIGVDGQFACWGIPNTPGMSAAPRPLTTVSVGLSHTCGLDASGKVACWGLAQSNVVTLAPTATGFTRLRSGTQSACAWTAANAVTCWGDSPPNMPTLASGQTWRDIHQLAASGHGCGVTSTGDVRCWASGTTLAHAPTSVLAQPYAAGWGPFTNVAIGENFSCGLESDGEIRCWGAANADGRTVPPPGTGFTEFDVGRNHGCALNGSGAITCWGSNSHGQTAAPSGPFRTITTGFRFTCGIRPSGSTACWGENATLYPPP
jgi:hypothetical protein